MPAQHFCFLLVEEFSHLAFSCAVEPLRIANLLGGKDLYSWSFASRDGAMARSSNDVRTLVDHGFDRLPDCDRLFVLSGIHMQRHIDDVLLAALRRAHRHGVQVGALCSGAWILAKSGLLDGKRAAIHWEYHDAFAEEFPDVDLVRSVFVPDDPHVTASGGTATADLMLSLIETDHGSDLATAVADQMVYTAVRIDTAAQRVSVQSRNGIRNKHLVAAIRLMQDTIEHPLNGTEIAGALGISRRQLERLFSKHLDTTPKAYFMDLRLQRAQHLLVQTEASVVEVAIACGFESPGHFARVYRAAYGVTPIAQRNRLT